jgi:CubicO group peptidase (beta-lactamase class C family)
MSRPRARFLAILAVVLALWGCTTYRIIRYRNPGPTIHRAYASRTVPSAAQPFVFGRAQGREELDSLCVHDVDGVWRPLDDYFKRHSVLAFLVIQDDAVVYEHYAPGVSSGTLWNIFSASKSVFSSLVGLAVDRGKLRLEDPVTKYLTEYAGNPDFENVTVGQLLTMHSGFRYSRTTGHALHDLRSDDARFQYGTDLRPLLAGLKREEAPGTRWAYKDSDTELLGRVLERATGETISSQFARDVWQRIGTERNSTWSLDRPGGLEKVSTGFNATVLDLARFGRLYLNGGDWNGTQVLPREWVEASTTLDRSRTEPEVRTWWRMQHNHLWWIPMFEWDRERDFFADGHAGQRIYVHPPTRTIIVQIANDSRQDFPFRRIAKYLAGTSFHLAKNGVCTMPPPK